MTLWCLLFLHSYTASPSLTKPCFQCPFWPFSSFPVPSVPVEVPWSFWVSLILLSLPNPVEVSRSCWFSLILLIFPDPAEFPWSCWVSLILLSLPDHAEFPWSFWVSPNQIPDIPLCLPVPCVPMILEWYSSIDLPVLSWICLLSWQF